MSPVALIFFLLAAGACFTSTRRYATVPLLLGCCYITMGQGIKIGPLNFPIYRMLLLTGLVRVLMKGEKPIGGINGIDKLLFAWAAWVFLASLFHENIPGSGPEYTLGVIFTTCLSYFLFRILVRDFEDVRVLVKVIAIILVPVAAEMVMEKVTGKNAFSVFGGVSPDVVMREGKLRAQGPFLHPIMAGTVGAVTFPLVIGLWERARTVARVGAVGCVVMVIASNSSGPIMSLLFACFAIFLWRYRHLTGQLRWMALGAYLLLELVMKQPAYYVIAKVNISGGSTGWHRARLIEQAIAHFPEWWIFGTDATKHWMPYGVVIGERHADITNYYIAFGVLGGFASMLLLILMLVAAFKYVGRTLRSLRAEQTGDQFFAWCLGAGLFAHAATSISVSYLDQSSIFFWMNLAMISSLYAAVGQKGGNEEVSRPPLAPTPVTAAA